MAMAEIKVIVGPHSLGVTLQLTEDVTVYVGMPAPENAASDAELERTARRRAARLLRMAAEELEVA